MFDKCGATGVGAGEESEDSNTSQVRTIPLTLRRAGWGGARRRNVAPRDRSRLQLHLGYLNISRNRYIKIYLIVILFIDNPDDLQSSQMTKMPS